MKVEIILLIGVFIGILFGFWLGCWYKKGDKK